MKYNYKLNKFEDYVSKYEVRRGSVNWANAVQAAGEHYNIDLKEEDLVNLYDYEDEREKAIINNARARTNNRLCPILIREYHNSYRWSILYYYLKTDVDMLLANTKR